MKVLSVSQDKCIVSMSNSEAELLVEGWPREEDVVDLPSICRVVWELDWVLGQVGPAVSTVENILSNLRTVEGILKNEGRGCMMDEATRLMLTDVHLIAELSGSTSQEFVARVMAIAKERAMEWYPLFLAFEEEVAKYRVGKMMSELDAVVALN